MTMVVPSLDDRASQFIHGFAFLGKHGFMARALGLTVKIPRPVRFGVVFDLEGVAADEDLRRPDKTAEGLLIIVQKALIGARRRVARHDEQHRNCPLIATHRVHAVG